MRVSDFAEVFGGSSSGRIRAYSVSRPDSNSNSDPDSEYYSDLDTESGLISELEPKSQHIDSLDRGFRRHLNDALFE